MKSKERSSRIEKEFIKMADDTFDALLNDIDVWQVTDVLNRNMNISENEEKSKSRFEDQKKVQESSAGYPPVTRSTNRPSIVRRREWIDHPMHEELWKRKKGEHLNRPQLEHWKYIFRKYSNDRQMIMRCYNLSRSSIRRILSNRELISSIDSGIITNSKFLQIEDQKIQSILESAVMPPTYSTTLPKLNKIVENETGESYTIHRIRSFL